MATYANPVAIGPIPEATFNEKSGVVEGPEGVWMHEDSGNAPYKLGLFNPSTAAVVQVFDLGIASGDYEDMTRSPRALWLMSNSAKTLTKICEPRLGQPWTPNIKVKNWIGWSKGVESVARDPVTGDFFLIQKYKDATGDPNLRDIVRIRAGEIAKPANLQAVVLGRLSFSGDDPSAMDISADGALILVNSISHIYVWERTAQETVFAAMQAAPTVLNSPPGDGNGEAACFLENGDKIGHVKERVDAIWYLRTRLT